MRGNLYQVDEYEFARSDNGTHMLVPVEVWERVVREIDRIAKPRYGDVPEDAERLARRALAEIGGEDGG